MTYKMRGLSEEAHKFLDENRAQPGQKCWCCGLPIPEDPIIISAFQEWLLHRYLLKTPGMVAEEHVQATVEQGDETFVYLALWIKPDGIMAHGDSQVMQWKADVLIGHLFPGGQ